MKRYRLTAVIWREGRRYVSKCPELGVASYGATLEKAKKALQEAVSLYLENAQKLGILSDIKPALDFRNRYTTELEVAII
jgi:predicted RNase H-like HicB family nuclease